MLAWKTLAFDEVAMASMVSMWTGMPILDKGATCAAYAGIAAVAVQVAGDKIQGGGRATSTYTHASASSQNVDHRCAMMPEFI